MDMEQPKESLDFLRRVLRTPLPPQEGAPQVYTGRGDSGPMEAETIYALGLFFIDICGLMFSFGLGSCMWRDMGILHSMVAVGRHRKSIRERIGWAKLGCLVIMCRFLQCCGFVQSILPSFPIWFHLMDPLMVNDALGVHEGSRGTHTRPIRQFQNRRIKCRFFGFLFFTTPSGAKHSPPASKDGRPRGWIRGGHRDCWLNHRFPFFDLKKHRTRICHGGPR